MDGESVAAQPLPCPRAARTQHLSACMRVFPPSRWHGGREFPRVFPFSAQKKALPGAARGQKFFFGGLSLGLTEKSHFQKLDLFVGTSFPCARRKRTAPGLLLSCHLFPGPSPRAGTSGVSGANFFRGTAQSGAISGPRRLPDIVPRQPVATPWPIYAPLGKIPRAAHKKGEEARHPPFSPRLFVSFEPRTGHSTRGLSKFRPPRDRHSVRTPFLRFPPWPPADRRDRPAPPRNR